MNKKIWIAIAVISIFTVLCSLIVFRAPKDNAGEGTLDKIKLAYIPYSADLPFFVALQKGMFKQRGLNVEPIKCASSSEALDLVLAGKVKGAMGNSFSVLFSIHAKNPNVIRLINVSCETLEQNRYTGFILVRPNSDIKKAEDLRGKTVGTGKGSSQLLWVQLYFKSLGWDPKQDVLIEQEAPETLLNALHSGQFDAVFVFEPYATIGISKGLAKPLIPFFRQSIINPFPAGGATLSRDFFDNHPKTAGLVIKALDQAIDFINRNPEDAKKILLSFTPLSEKEALESQIYFWWGSKEMAEESIQKLSDILADNALLSRRIDILEMLK